MNIIGLNNEMYISSACLSSDGQIIAAGAEERFTRDKLTRAFPHHAMAYCLEEAGMTVTDIDFFATSWNPGVYFKKFNPLFSGKRRHLVEQLYSVPDHIMQLYGRPDVDYVYQENAGEFGKSRVYHITHHRAHAANGFFLSPFDSAAILTADAQGEVESTTYGRGQGNHIAVLKTLSYPHSLGAFYSTFTEYLGFRPNSDEWKVMAMASYADGENPYYGLMKDQVVHVLPDGTFELDLRFFKGFLHDQPHLYTGHLVQAFGPPRHNKDDLQDRHFEIAAALQRVTEEVAVHLLHWLHAQTGETSLVLSGGSFMNSVFNGKVLELTPFEKIFISSCPDDSGNCFGAALYLYHHILDYARSEPMRHNYYGPSYSDQAIQELLEAHKIRYAALDDVCDHTAGLLEQGKIVGWFQGRMEFGQRALGNRSILADPRRADMQDKVNLAVKFRESFRPFAPAILQEKQSEYFDTGAGGDVPFMEKVYFIKPHKRQLIPAVAHVDGTGRLQTVQHETNPVFHELIHQFERRTGVPVLLNTSFNLNGEPIVCSPHDALKTFFSCGMDCLVLGRYLIEK